MKKSSARKALTLDSHEFFITRHALYNFAKTTAIVEQLSLLMVEIVILSELFLLDCNMSNS